MKELITNPKWRERVENIMLVMGLLGPLAGVPQLIKVYFTHDHLAHRVSLTTWGMYAFIASCWSVYGFLLGRKPIFLSNGLTALIDFLVVFKLLLAGCYV